MESVELTTSTSALKELSGKRVFLTGHTGFKGSWMVALLGRLGCEVHGFALLPRTEPNLYTLSSAQTALAGETFADIRDRQVLTEALTRSRPDLVLHMAAQAFVRRSYVDPADTWDVNVMGTVNLLEATRACRDVSAVVVVTTDKCYENRGWEWGYRESDRLGGHDPYSASKAAAELVVQSYRRSFFNSAGPLLASARAGNVIGGGDWSEDRLVADAARAVVAGETLMIRNPGATRPWQHVLDCIGGYLVLAAALLRGEASAATAFNFGPAASDNVAVSSFLAHLKRHWPELEWGSDKEAATAVHESSFLHLDSARAKRQLNWTPRWPLDMALARTAEWYRTVAADPARAKSVTAQQIEDFLS